jgi:hypothetical protein
MANLNVIKIKNSTVPGKVPKPDDIQRAELAINLVDKKIYTKDQNDDIIELGADYVKKGEALKAKPLTQTAYDALGTKDPNTLYLITGP